MTSRTPALVALIVLGTACAQPADEPQTAGREPASAVLQQPISQARVASDKPLIHVWKSPT
jgi:hypothetical protein